MGLWRGVFLPKPGETVKWYISLVRTIMIVYTCEWGVDLNGWFYRNYILSRLLSLNFEGAVGHMEGRLEVALVT